MKDFVASNIPTVMRAERRWCLWVLEDRDGKKTKLPINALTGFGAKSNDPSTWAGFGVAFKAFKEQRYPANGLGFFLGNGWFGVDVDHVSEDGAEIVEALEKSLQGKAYEERSQSGDGVHFICKGSLPAGRRRKGHLEMYDSNRFFALTSDTLPQSATPEDCTEAIGAIYNTYLADKPAAPSPSAYFTFRRAEAYATHPDRRILSDEEVLAKARESSRGASFQSLWQGEWEGRYPSHSEADGALCMALAFWTGKDRDQMDRLFRQSGLMREKWDIKRGELTYGEKTIQSACEKTYDVYSAAGEDDQAGRRAALSEETNNALICDDKHGGTGDAAGIACYPLNDTGNAQRFADMFGRDVKYNADNKKWLFWDGYRWAPDAMQEVRTLADKLIAIMTAEVGKASDRRVAQDILRNVQHLSSNNGKNAMLNEAQHFLACRNSDFDQDPWLLNCKNGVVDLRTGAIRPHKREDMLTKCTHVDCDLEGTPTLWMDTLDGIFCHKTDLVDFVQKCAGYTASGDTRENCFFQCFGNGANGKSLFFETIRDALGDYSLNIQIDTILAQRTRGGGTASPDIARMAGARFVRTNEPDERTRFAEGLIKQLTGNDTITARYLYGEEFEFRPVAKIWIACNYKINIRGTDKGIWRRQRVIPFEATFEGKDDDKTRAWRLRQELPQILGWIVKGCLRWQKEGLEPPTDVKAATEEYRSEMDVISQFLKDRCVIRPDARVKSSTLFAAYKAWGKTGEEYVMSQTKFGTEITKKFKKEINGGYVYYHGIALKDTDTGYVFDRYDGEH